MTHIYFVLKTADADRLWDYGPGYVRLAAWAVDDGEVEVSTSRNRELLQWDTTSSPSISEHSSCTTSSTWNNSPSRIGP